MTKTNQTKGEIFETPRFHAHGHTDNRIHLHTVRCQHSFQIVNRSAVSEQIGRVQNDEIESLECGGSDRVVQLGELQCQPWQKQNKNKDENVSDRSVIPCYKRSDETNDIGTQNRIQKRKSARSIPPT